MKSPLLLASLALVTSVLGQGNESRLWTSKDGRQVKAVLVSFDAAHVTLRLADGSDAKVPFEKLSPADQAFLKAQPPGVIALGAKVAPRKWPTTVEIQSSAIEVKLVTEEPRKFVYRSEGFEYTSQGKLLPSLMKEVARTFEATKKLVGDLPWGIVCRPPEGLELYQAALYETRNDYMQAGGPSNSGGVYMSGEKIFKIPFESLGIKRLGKSYTKDENYSSDTLVHEITHQMMHDYLPYMPKWAIEGSAEYAELLPYKAGTFGVARHKEGLRDYLEVWRNRGRTPKLPNVSELFRLKRKEWDEQAMTPDRQHALYQQSALLVYYFNHLDGDGSGARWIKYMDATKAEADLWVAYEKEFKAYRAAMDEFFKLPGVKKLEGGRFTYPSNLKAPQPPAAPDGKAYDEDTPLKNLKVLLDGRNDEQLQQEIGTKFSKAGFRLGL
ncbi:MAG: hypothetical protein JNM99_02740 [Verrucomicrobiaceae bacterium]|nr:hypothetical protein [Verrucomicrobiaceae bacterium]